MKFLAFGILANKKAFDKIVIQRFNKFAGILFNRHGKDCKATGFSSKKYGHKKTGTLQGAGKN